MADLKRCGAYVYSQHRSTKPTCMAFKVRGAEAIHLIEYDKINLPWEQLPEPFRKQWTFWIEAGYEFSAHNLFFDMCIYKNVLVARQGWPEIPFEQFRCTAAKAAACALPRSLEGAGAALGLPTQKDKRGYVAMMATCKPTKSWKDWEKKRDRPEPEQFLSPKSNTAIWDTLYTYCKIDVKTTDLLDQSLPDLSESEQRVWFQNQKMNWRGLKVEFELITLIIAALEIESKRKLKQLSEVTLGLIIKPGSRQSIIDFLNIEGIELPDIRAKTVDDILNEGKLSPDMRTVLEIRKALSKTSTKKYQAFKDRMHDDSRIRDVLLYHGASTGRDTGTGVQFQNLPKRLISQKQVEDVIQILESYWESPDLEETLDWIRTLYGEPVIVFSSLLRSMVIPNHGFELFVADFAKIEVAVLWWLAENEPGLRILRSGKDPYKYMAAINTGKRYDEIADDGDDRQLGKAQVLGCGFRMSWKRFRDTAWSFYRLKLTVKQSKDAVTAYREANAAVPQLWKNYESAAIAAVENPGKVYKTGKCRFSSKNKFLWIELPSGRRLAYFNPSTEWCTFQYDEPILDELTGDIAIDPDTGLEMFVTKKSTPRNTLTFWAVNPKTKKWSKEKTHGGILAENVTQAVARDLLKQGELRLEAAGYQVLLAVHDESICEREIDCGSVEEFTRILCERPMWGDENLLIEAKGWSGMRYRK